MSEEQNKRKKYITTYEQIYQKLAKVTKIYLKYKTTKNFEYFITSERGENRTGLNNLLIELPEEDIIEVIRKQYISEPNNRGELGIIEPKDQAYEIRNIALLMLMSNRLSKEYKNRLEKNKQLDEATKIKYQKNERDLLVWKHNATSDLLASLYILQQAGEEEHKNLFSYGERRDEDNRSAFIIDLPHMGQISVHFGPEKMNIIEEAKNKAMSIIDRKRALGQISKNELKRLREQLITSRILPKYEGNLYEYTSAIPIEYIGATAKNKMNEMGIDTKLPEEITKEDIQKMPESGLNEREAYYLAIKLGYSKKQLKEVIEVYNQRQIPDEVKIGRGAVRMTTAAERATVLQVSQRNLNRYRGQGSNRAIGG